MPVAHPFALQSPSMADDDDDDDDDIVEIPPPASVLHTIQAPLVCYCCL